MATENLVRTIYLLTNNVLKAEEFKIDFFKPYGINVKMMSKKSSQEDIKDVLLSSKGKNKVLFVLREKTRLIDGLTNLPLQTNIYELTNYHPLIHRSDITLYSIRGDEVVDTEYYEKSKGYVDLTKKIYDDQREAQKVYNWDDVFTLFNSGMTYLEHKCIGSKVSPRDINISSIIRDIVYYKQLLNLAYFPHEQKKPIDFKYLLKDFVLNIKQFNPDENQKMRSFHLQNLIFNAINQGAFFRAPENRREKLYWCPGLNAGIPYTKKIKDPAHELTYMFHDFSHFNIPDLVYDGVNTPLHQAVYIGYRLMSEVITLVMSDMVFVDCMIQNGFKYDTVNQRRIYPIFQNMNLSGFTSSQEKIRFILIGSFEYCFFGDMSRWESVMEDKTPIEPFKNKYDAYFIEDARWTSQNYKNMTSRNLEKSFAMWWSFVSQTIKDQTPQLHLQSVSEFMDENDINSQTFDLNKDGSYERLMRVIFTAMTDKYLFKSVFVDGDIPILSDDVIRKRAFIRWAVGQMFVFFKYPNNEKKYQIMNILMSILSKNDITLEDIIIFQHHYYEYLKILTKNGFISLDEQLTYRYTFPIFDPFIIDYDHVDYDQSVSTYVKSFVVPN